jgi:hypothetical protein
VTSPGGGAAAGEGEATLREDAEGLGDSDFAEGLFLFVREFELGVGEVVVGEFATGGFMSAEFPGDVGVEFAFDSAAFAEFEDGDGLALDGGAEFLGTGEVALELVEFGAEDLDERRIRRGTKMIARRAAAVALTRKSLLERGCGFGEMTRRALPMVAFTCGSDVTGIGEREGRGVAAREALGEALGETGESGTASGSISGSGWR